MSFIAAARLLSAVVLLSSAWNAGAQPAALSAAQIVERMTEQNHLRSERLSHLRSIRHYRVEYQGYSSMTAEMEVEAVYDHRAGKNFRILSESGSHTLLEKVLHRALESEREAARRPEATALDEANYRFTLAGVENFEGRPAYVLEVEPHVPSKFLYRGKVWIDAENFAVVRIASSPAKNPSFWITHTSIEQTYAHVGEFWLPARNRSESRVRVGGTAILTIDYGQYQIHAAPAGKVSNPEPR